jgi:predicted dehydrogenase
MESNGVIRIGILGAGHAANKGHLPVLSSLSGIEVTAICDTDEDRARKAAEDFKIPKIYTDFSEMLEKEKLHAVDILTSPDTHVDLAIQAMEHGCHCLMEKPLAVTTADADRAIKKAKETGLGLYVTHNWSFSPAMRRAKAMVASGALGKVTSVNVRYLTSLTGERYFDPDHWCHRLPGGIFADISPHLVMVLLDFLDDVNAVKSISKKVSEYPYIVADELKVMVEARNGLGSFTLSFNSPFRSFTVDVVGTKKSLSLDARTQIMVIRKPITDRPVVAVREGIPRGLKALGEIFQQLAGLSSMTVNVLLGRQDALEGHRYLMTAAFDNIRGKAAYPIDPWKCREVVRILEEAFQSG